MSKGLLSPLLILIFPLPVYCICYYPDGSVAPQDTPCSDASAESTCCGQGYACLSNNICMATGDEIIKKGASLYVRGSCTDQKWRSSSCPLFCINPNEPNFDLVAGGTGIAKCEKTSEDVYYCMDENTDNVDCEKLVNVLSFRDSPTVVTTIGVISSATSTMSMTTSVSTTSTASIIDPFSRISGSGRQMSSTTGPTTTSMPTATTTPDIGLNTSARVGIAVGVSLAGLIAISIAVGVWYFRGKHKTILEPSMGLHNPSTSSPHRTISYRDLLGQEEYNKGGVTELPDHRFVRGYDSQEAMSREVIYELPGVP